MFLQYYLNEEGDRVYTLKKFDPMGQQTCSAHPARFSPDDKYSRHRITIKKRFKVLMTQQPRPVLWRSLKLMSLLRPVTPRRLRNQTPQSVSPDAFLPAILCGIQSHRGDWACLCEAVMVASPIKGTRLTFFSCILSYYKIIKDKMVGKTLTWCCWRKGLVVLF